MTRTSSARHPFRDLARAASWHRRKLAAVAAIAAVITGISAARPPDPPTVEVVRASHEIAAGTTVSAADVQLDRIPVGAAPTSPLDDLDSVIGQSVTGAVADGQVVTALDLRTPRGSRAGVVVAPLRLADAQVAGLLHVGDRVDVIASGSSGGKARVVARDVLIVGLPRPPDDGGLASGDSAGPLVLVEVDQAIAVMLNEVAAGGRLGVVFR